MKVTLQEMQDFDSAIKREPLVLLERIEQLMHTPEKAKYPALTAVEILSNFLRCKQGKKESLLRRRIRILCKKSFVILDSPLCKRLTEKKKFC